MRAGELLELAALACLNAEGLVKGQSALCGDSLSEYWIASRCRLDSWITALKQLSDSQSASEGSGQRLVQLAEEIIVSEPLSRSVAAITKVHDHRHQVEETSAIGQNTLDAHRDASRRLKPLLSTWLSSSSDQLRHIQSLARHTQRWTDVLLAYVGPIELVEPIACDRNRLREFAFDSHTHGKPSSEATAQLLLYSLRSSAITTTQDPLNPKQNRRIAGAAMGLFGPDVFDSLGLLQPTWMIRAERSSEETIAMIDRLFAEDFSTDPATAPTRWRT